MTLLRQRSGQGTTEMIFLIPLMVMLAAGVISVSYICWQGIKVQEAANLGARIAGQETVGGAKDFNQQMRDNGAMTGFGVNAVGDVDPTQECNDPDPKRQQACLKKLVENNGAGSGLGTKPGAEGAGDGVYWTYRKAIYNLFNAGEQKKLYVPQPQILGGSEVEVRVSRVMRPPKVLGWQPPIVRVDAKAYGGEDTYMFSMARWGHTDNGDLLWKQIFKNPELADKDPSPNTN